MSYDCFCDYDPPAFISKSKPVARKAFRCVECGCEIRPGERYERVSGKWEGYFDRFETCERCHDLRQWVINNVPCFCWSFGNLREDAKEAIDEARHRAPAETVGIRFGLLRRLVLLDRFNRARRAA